MELSSAKHKWFSCLDNTFFKMNFLCSQCGACCKIAGTIKLMPDRGDGACVHLLDNNLCSIYNVRPDICKVDKMFEIKSKQDPDLTLKQHYINNTKSCHDLIDLMGLDSEYKIDIEEYNK